MLPGYIYVARRNSGGLGEISNTGLATSWAASQVAGAKSYFG